MNQINPDSFFNALQGISALITVYILFLTQKTNNRALATARQNLEANILLKQMDVYNACSIRYEQIVAESQRLCKLDIDDKDGIGFFCASGSCSTISLYSFNVAISTQE
jgi:hypothetical protein